MINLDTQPNRHASLPSADDHVRLYLEQIGKHALLTRDEERAIARRVASTAQAFRRLLLHQHVVLEYATKLLADVEQRKLRVDRVLDVGSNEAARKNVLRQILRSNLATLKSLLSRNEEAVRQRNSPESSVDERKRLDRDIRRGRHKCVALLEEVELRGELLMEPWEQLRVLGERAELLQHQVADLRSGSARREAALAELVDIESTAQQPVADLLSIVRRLQDRRAAYEQAQRELANGNLRLVVAMAKSHVRPDFHLLDAIQEGNRGLMRATEKFDYRRELRFSTYATWWIRRAILQASPNAGRSVRMPFHLFSYAREARRVQERFWKECEREPTVDDYATQLGVTRKQAEQVVKVLAGTQSLDQPPTVESTTSIGELLEDRKHVDPSEALQKQETSEHVNRLLGRLAPRERLLVRLRYGLEDGEHRTFKQLGDLLGVTRERVRQIERVAFQKMAEPENAAKT